MASYSVGVMAPLSSSSSAFPISLAPPDRSLSRAQPADKSPSPDAPGWGSWRNQLGQSLLFDGLVLGRRDGATVEQLLGIPDLARAAGPFVEPGSASRQEPLP